MYKKFSFSFLARHLFVLNINLRLKCLNLIESVTNNSLRCSKFNHYIYVGTVVGYRVAQVVCHRFFLLFCFCLELNY